MSIQDTYKGWTITRTARGYVCERNGQTMGAYRTLTFAREVVDLYGTW